MIKVNILGDLERDLKKEIKITEKGMQNAVREAGFEVRKGWQNQIKRAGLGNKLPRTIRYKFYKNKSYNPAILVFTKAPRVIRAFDQGTIIRPKRTKYLAVPTKFAPKRGVGGGRGPLARRITPSNFPEERLGKLRFVPKRGSRNAMLVVNGLRKSYSRKTGKFRVSRASARARSRGQAEAVPMFTLVPQVTLKKRTDVASVTRRIHTKLPQMISAAIDKERRKSGE